MLAFYASLTVSILVCWVIQAFDPLHRHVSVDSPQAGLPQKIHDSPTPRIGGLAIFLGVATAIFATQSVLAAELTGIALVCLVVGLAEDLTRRVSPATRYIAALLAGLLAYVFLDARIVRLDVPWLDLGLRLWPLSCILTVFAIASFAHATNLTDGTHGLAAGLSIISLTATGSVATTVGDLEIARACWLCVGALCGFFLFNFPWGRIFLGDGGAYFSGAILAVLAILLVRRNPSVSPWFALLALAHPVVETLFTVIRRVAVHQMPIGQPDRFHLHTLLYHRLLQGKLMAPRHCNAMASALLLMVNALMAVIAVSHWQQTTWLMAQFSLFSVLFVLSWRGLMKQAEKNTTG